MASTHSNRAASFERNHTTPASPAADDRCVVCLENYGDKTAGGRAIAIASIQGCTHVFHLHCVTDLLNARPEIPTKCPLCRTIWMQADPDAVVRQPVDIPIDPARVTIRGVSFRGRNYAAIRHNPAVRAYSPSPRGEHVTRSQGASVGDRIPTRDGGDISLEDIYSFRNEVAEIRRRAPHDAWQSRIGPARRAVVQPRFSYRRFHAQQEAHRLAQFHEREDRMQRGMALLREREDNEAREQDAARRDPRNGVDKTPSNDENNESGTIEEGLATQTDASNSRTNLLDARARELDQRAMELPSWEDRIRQISTVLRRHRIEREQLADRQQAEINELLTHV